MRIFATLHSWKAVVRPKPKIAKPVYDSQAGLYSISSGQFPRLADRHIFYGKIGDRFTVSRDGELFPVRSALLGLTEGSRKSLRAHAEDPRGLDEL